MNAQKKAWLLKMLLLSEERSLSQYETEIFAEIYEELNFDEVLSLVNKARKLSLNIDSRNSFLKQQNENYVPPKRVRSRPHRPQRKRGYTDKGTLPEPQQVVLRRIKEEDCLHRDILEQNCPSLLRDLGLRFNHTLSEWGDYIILSRLSDLIQELEDENLLSQRSYWEIDELSDFVSNKRKGN